MKKLLFIYILFILIGCDNKQEATCNTPFPQFTRCIDGERNCTEGYVRVPGTSEDLGCVKKGQYDFICVNPCPPYNHIILSSNNFPFQQSIGSPINDMTEIYYTTDIGNPNNPKDWFGPNPLQLFLDEQQSNSKRLYLKTSGISNLYEFWDGEKNETKQSRMNGFLNETKDTLRLNCKYGFYNGKYTEKKECNMIFVRTKEL